MAKNDIMGTWKDSMADVWNNAGYGILNYICITSPKSLVIGHFLIVVLPLVATCLLLKYMLPLPFVATYFTTYLCCYLFVLRSLSLGTTPYPFLQTWERGVMCC